MTGVSMNFSTSAKLTISSNLAAISARRMPRMAPLRKMFSRPVSSGWKPVPTSSRLPTRPRISARPVVGSVIRDRILSSVVLPAPLRPMMPTTSPGAISNETSRRAQIDAVSVSGRARPSERSRPTRDSRSEPKERCSPSR